MKLKQIILTALLTSLVFSFLTCKKSGPVFNPQTLPFGLFVHSEGVTLVPESERPLDFFIMGLDPLKSNYFLLPDITDKIGIPKKDLIEAEKNLYWLKFELSHGAIMRFLPPYTHLFVSVPSSSGVKGQVEKEETYFREYLSVRCGWAGNDIESRVHFFITRETLDWAQDLGEILGRDAENHAVINVGQTGQMTRFRQDIRTLAEAFSSHFRLKVLPKGINAEGGDEELVRIPDGQIGLMVGRHRILSYLEYRDKVPIDTYLEKQIDGSDISDARAFFSKAFFGLPVLIIPEKILSDPSQGTEELFHLDMMASVLYNHKNFPDAFVPTYLPNPADIMSGELLDQELIAKAQREYDLVAAQLKDLGYRVTRLPFSDHPVRGPVNFVKYYDRAKDRFIVLLPKYPYHLSVKSKNSEKSGSSASPYQRIRTALDALEETSNNWQAQPSIETYRSLTEAFADIWKNMQEVERMPNPIFETQAELIRKSGYDVVAVPCYPGGSGSLHCQGLR
jgi:hypothetical protein